MRLSLNGIGTPIQEKVIHVHGPLFSLSFISVITEEDKEVSEHT